MARKLKVLHTMTWLAKGGGPDNEVYLMLRELKAAQEIHLAVGSEIQHNLFEGMDGIKFFVCPDLVRRIRPIKDLKAFFYLYRLIKKERYDIVQTHETKASLITRLAARLAGCPRIIYRLHGVTFNDPMSSVRRAFYVWLEKVTIGAAHQIAAVSQSVSQAYLDRGIGARVPGKVIYSGIDLAYFNSKKAASADRRSRLRNELGVKDDDILLINVGRFSHSKAQRFTIEAFARLKAKRPNLKLLLVGEGELKEDCRGLARKLGVADDTIFYGFSDNIPEILSLADLQLLTSLREGLPRVVVESYLCRVPVASFEVEGIREIIEDGITGFVVRQGDVAALAERAEAMIGEPVLRRRFAELGYERAAKLWDHREMVESFKSIYESDGAALVKDFFDGYASDFDGIYGHSGTRGPVGRWIDRNLRKTMFLRFQEVLKNTADGRIRSVLDVGCGPGHYCVEFIKQGKKVVGLDIAEGMLKLAARTTAADRQPDKIAFVKADYLKHEFKERFDAACLMGFFDYIERPVEVIEKLKKDVSKEIYASFPCDSGLLAHQRRLRYWLRNCPLYLYSRRDIDAILKAAGVRHYEVKDFGRDYFVKMTLEPA